jgi:hypothetical protein
MRKEAGISAHARQRRLEVAAGGCGGGWRYASPIVGGPGLRRAELAPRNMTPAGAISKAAESNSHKEATALKSMIRNRRMR